MNSQFGSPQARLFGNELTLTAMTPAADAAPFQLAPHSGTLIPYSLIIVVSILIFFFFFFFFFVCAEMSASPERLRSPTIVSALPPPMLAAKAFAYEKNQVLIIFSALFK
jgi:hypothetical protein